MEHFLFDLDGTLTDPGLGITNSIMYSLKPFGIEVSDRRELYVCIGPPLIDCYMKLWGFSLEDAKKALSVYREYFSVKGLFENEVYDGIEDVLASLKNAGKRIYLATSKPEIYAKQILEHFGLLKYFDFVAGNTLDESRPKKSDVIKYIMQKFPEINACNAIMIGDRKYDIEGARECSLDAVGVLYGYGNREELEGAKYLAQDPRELKNILLK